MATWEKVVVVFAQCASIALAICLDADRIELAAVILLPPALWGLFYLATLSGGARQTALRDEFKKEMAAQSRKETAHSFRLGGVNWAIKDGGLHKIAYWHDGTPSPEPGTDHRSRLEKQRTSEGVKTLLAILFPFCVLVGVVQKHVNDTIDASQAQSATVAMFLIGIIGTCTVSLWELAYRRGLQFIPGAMVLDPVPISRGERDVEEQQAFGDRRWSKEDEALNAASGDGARRLPVHDREF